MFSLFLSSVACTPLRITLDLVAGCLCVFLLRAAWSYLHTAYHLRNVPGPPAPSLFWGSDWDVHTAVPGMRYREWKAAYGDVVKIKGALGRTHLAISDPRAVKFILEERRFDFPKPNGVREWFRSLVGDGLLSNEDKSSHTHQRRIFAPAFNPTAIRFALPTFYSTATQFADTLAARIDASREGVIEEDMQWWTNRWSLDNIGLAGFSYKFDSLPSPGDAVNPNANANANANTNVKIKVESANVTDAKLNPAVAVQNQNQNQNQNSQLAIALEALTNTADNFASFVMKALFFTFPWILKIPSQKGRYIRWTRETLGEVAISMWRAVKEGGKVEDKSLMAAMMKAEGADNLTQQEVAAHLSTLVQAGYETVGCQMAWLLYELAHHPRVQARLREELAQLGSEPSFEDLSVPVSISVSASAPPTPRGGRQLQLPADPNDPTPTSNPRLDLNQLTALAPPLQGHAHALARPHSHLGHARHASNPTTTTSTSTSLSTRPSTALSGRPGPRAPYLDAVVRESLRLHPPIIELTHVARRDTVVPLSEPLPGTNAGGQKEVLVPAGTVLNVPVDAVQTCKDAWGPDAWEFRPERWLGASGTGGDLTASGCGAPLLAFSTGPRICPGRHFAMLEMKALTAVLLGQFTLRPVPSKPVEPFWSFVVRPRVKGESGAGLPVLVERVKY